MDSIPTPRDLEFVVCYTATVESPIGPTFSSFLSIILVLFGASFSFLVHIKCPCICTTIFFLSIGRNYPNFCLLIFALCWRLSGHLVAPVVLAVSLVGLNLRFSLISTVVCPLFHRYWNCPFIRPGPQVLLIPLLLLLWPLVALVILAPFFYFFCFPLAAGRLG